MNNDLVITQPGELLTLPYPGPLDRNPAAVYLASLANEKARRVQRDALTRIAWLLIGQADCLSCNWAALRSAHTMAIRSRLADRYSPASANRMLSALRGTLKAAWRLDLMGGEDYQKAIDIPNVKGETLPAGRALSAGEIAALMRSCEDDPTPAGARDAAIIACMYPGGLRRDEVVKLNLADYDPATGTLKVLHAKGSKQRAVYLLNEAGRAMADWLAIRGNEPGSLFCAISKAGKLSGQQLSNQAIYNLLQKRGKQAGVSDLSPHDLRRTVASDLLEAGADLLIVSKTLGHVSTDTTGRYDMRPEAAKQRAAGLLHLPYHGRQASHNDR